MGSEGPLAVVMRNRVAVSLDLFPALPPALALELQERGTGNAHEVRRPGVSHQVRGDRPKARCATNPLEPFREAVLSERFACPSGKEGRIRLSIRAAVAQAAVEVTRNRRMQEHRSAFANREKIRRHAPSVVRLAGRLSLRGTSTGRPATTYAPAWWRNSLLLRRSMVP